MLRRVTGFVWPLCVFVVASDALHGQAGWVGRRGSACSSPALTPLIAGSPAPYLGQSFRIGVSGARPSDWTWLMVGQTAATWNGLPLPLDLTSSGMTGCSLYVRPESVTVAQANATGWFGVDLQIPGLAALAGAQFDAQGFFVDPGANSLGLGATAGLSFQIGDNSYVQTVTQIQRQAITWTFDRPVQAGQYVNGDWWVVGPVGISQITPRSLSTHAWQRNGSMVNPQAYTLDHGYDASMYGTWAQGEYRRNLNVALDVSGANVLQLRPGQSLVSTQSASRGSMPQLDHASVLTCVGAPPDRDAFRPPYCGNDKTSHFTERDLDYSALLMLPRVAGTPSLASVERSIERLWLDHIRGWKGRWQHPTQNMPDYGRDMTAEIGVAALMLNLDFTPAEKRDLLIYMVQLGIDLYGVAQDGGHWFADGGHTAGRKLPIIMAGRLLNHSGMLNIATTNTAFGEDGQTFYVQQTSPGVYNYGHGGYTAQHVGLPEWGFAHAQRPDRDDQDWYGDPYRRCCSANCWGGHHLVALAMGLKSAWRHDAYFDYIDRYMTIEPQGTWTRQWDRWTETMWDTYRPMF